MKDPYPINEMTPEKVRSLGWTAEARDADGHLISMQAGPPRCGVDEIADFVKMYGTDCTITIWPFGDKL